MGISWTFQVLWCCGFEMAIGDFYVIWRLWRIPWVLREWEVRPAKKNDLIHLFSLWKNVCGRIIFSVFFLLQFLNFITIILQEPGPKHDKPNFIQIINNEEGITHPSLLNPQAYISTFAQNLVHIHLENNQKTTLKKFLSYTIYKSISHQCLFKMH